MQKSDDKRGRNKGFAVSAARGFITGLAVILIVFAIAAALISSGKLPEAAMKGVVWLASFLGALAGAVAAIKNYGSQALATGATVGAAIFVITLIGAAFSEDGAIVGPVTPGIVIALLLGSVMGSFLCTRRKGRKRG